MPGEPESEAGEEECQLLLLYFGDGSFGATPTDCVAVPATEKKKS
jgi:hypothetical protein